MSAVLNGETLPGMSQSPAGHTLVHGPGIVQRVTCSNVLVVGQDHQQEALGVSKEEERIQLCHTIAKEDGAGARQEVSQHPGEHDAGMAYVQERQLAEEVVHGGMALEAETDGQQDDKIPQQSQQVDG